MQRWTIATTILLTGAALSGSTAVLAQETAGLGPKVEQSATPMGTAPAKTATEATTEEQPTVSQVRIVRLSQVHGVVLMDRNLSHGYEAAFANIPVVAGARLKTEDGVAEVEFEDNSSLRLGPHTEVSFARLGRMASGGTATTVNVEKGLVYVGLEKTKGNEFALRDGKAQVDVQPGAHLRLAADAPEAQIAEFDGISQVVMGSSVTTVGKHQTVTVEPISMTVSTLTKGTEEGDWDEWDKQQNDYHKQKATLANVGGFGLYGANDLGYYGSFVDMPGCGSLWRPYFASAAWDPFASGVWAYYPTGGYSWVSPYPWGWLPYHSGQWVSCGTSGWGWQPGGSWYGVNNVQAMRINGRPLPHPVPPSPVRNAATLVPVNFKQLSFSGPDKNGFTMRRDSAGLGVPRSTFGNLQGYASHVQAKGVYTRSIPENSLVMPSATARPVASQMTMAATEHHQAAGTGRTALHSAFAPAHAGESGRSLSSSASMTAASMGNSSRGPSMSSTHAASSGASTSTASSSHK